MTKTLADMTAEEREECVGMWADATHCALQGIIMGVFLDHARVLIPENAAEYSDEEEYIWVLNHVTPRYDLRPAWTSKGEPFPIPALTKRSRDRKPISASEVQGILGTDWLDGKTPEELVREHREGKQ